MPTFTARSVINWQQILVLALDIDCRPWSYTEFESSCTFFSSTPLLAQHW